MVKNVSNQKEGGYVKSGFNTFLDGVLKLILVIFLIFAGIWVYRLTEPKVKLDDKTNDKIVELEKSNKRIEENQRLLEDKLDKYFSEIDRIDENIKDINNKK